MLNRRHLIRTLPHVALLGSAFAASLASAEERGNKNEARALADAALAHVAKAGFDAALKDFGTDKARWVQKDLYVAVFDFNGVCLAHGANEKLVGKTMLEIKDQNGKPFIREFVAGAQKGAEAWVDFDWMHPQTRKVEPKSMNVRRIPGRDALIAVGFYR